VSRLEIRVNRLYRRVELLKKLRKIENEILTNGMYSEQNEVRRKQKIDRILAVSTPRQKKMVLREEMLLSKLAEVKRKYVQRLLDEVEKLIKEVEEELNDG